MQDECNKQGFGNQPVDGDPGPKTLAGCPILKRGCSGNITKLKGLVVDGIVGLKMWSKLLGLS